MNKKILLGFIILLPILLGGSCEKRMFEFVSNVNLDNRYEIDGNSTFSETEIVTDNMIRSYLDDLPKDAQVTEVRIKALSVRLEPKSGNEVSAMSLSGTITDSESSETIFESSSYPIPLAGVDYPFVGINNVIAAGVSKAKGKIKKIILKNDFGNFQLTVNGKPTIGGDRLLLDIVLRVSIQIEYKQCIEVWDYFEGGEECTITTNL